MSATGGALHLTHIAMRADSPFAEFGEEFGFEVGRDGVLEAFGFVVDLPPFHAEEFGEHAFDEVVAQRELARDLAAGGGETKVAIGLNADQGILLQTANRHSDGGSGDLQPVCESCGDDGFPLAFGFEDSFEVVFFGDCNHLMAIIRRS